MNWERKLGIYRDWRLVLWSLFIWEWGVRNEEWGVVAASPRITLIPMKTNDVIPFYIARRWLKRIESCFTWNGNCKGYYSADFCGKTFPVTAIDKVISGYKRLWGYCFPITFYNPFNPAACGYCSMLEIVGSRIITFYIKGVLGPYMNCGPLPPLLTPHS